MTLQKTLLAASVAAAVLAPGLASAQHTTTANVTLATDYRFRGLTQTLDGPAIQGGFDYSHSSGLYAGNWNSNVSSALYPNANLEMDIYGGYKRSFGDFGLDVGLITYLYPGSRATITNAGQTCTNCKIDNTEGYVGVSWKWLSAKYYHAFSDFFSVPKTKNSHYLDLSATYDFGGGWGVNGHIGRQTVKNFTAASYSDWKLGVTKDLGAGFVIGLAYVGTNAKGDAGEPYSITDANQTRDIGDDRVVLTVGKTF
jgi:uncharacterized protein (TIGR02001 family)